MKKKDISIIGAGNMGTAMALVLADNGYNVKCWDINPEVVDSINKHHENKRYMLGKKLPKTITASTNLCEVAKFSKTIIFSIPSQHLRSTLKMLPKDCADYEVIVNCAKGIELKTGKFMSQVIEEEMGRKYHNKIVELSGPSIANEMSKKHFTAVIIASKNEELLSFLEKTMNNDYFRVRPSTDVLGTELGGIMKNIYSVAIGISDTLWNSMNTRALLLTEGLSEMAKMGHAMGTTKRAYYGLSGIGDLIATCLSVESRNYRFGTYLAKDRTVEEAQCDVQQVVEGYYAVDAIHKLAKKHNLDLPLCENMYEILYNEKDPATTLLRGF